MKTVIDSVRVYEVNGQVCTVKCAPLAASVANNQTVITAVTGKRLRVMGWIAQSNTSTVGSYLFKSASGGTARTTAIWAPPNTTVPCADKFPIVDCGYFETNAGEGLFTDVATAAVNLNVFYIEYTP